MHRSRREFFASPCLAEDEHGHRRFRDSPQPRYTPSQRCVERRQRYPWIDAPADFDSARIDPGVALTTLDASLARRVAGLGGITKSAGPGLILGGAGTGKGTPARGVQR